MKPLQLSVNYNTCAILLKMEKCKFSKFVKYNLKVYYLEFCFLGPSACGFGATVCKTVCPMLANRCLSVLSVLSDVLWCIVAK